MNVHVSLRSTDIPHSSTDILEHFVMLFASKAVSLMASLSVGVAQQPQPSFTRKNCSPPSPKTKSVPEPDEIGNVIEEVVDLARQINLEVIAMVFKNSLCVCDSHNREPTIDELIEMHGQEQDIEGTETLDPVQSEDLLGRPQFKVCDYPKIMIFFKN
ncbi:hypothetical protein TNCV_3663181 [Trichonephila clavipes]|nr:hypothetical protein TNCV_3663181 [Trichonephila clavipes]